VSSYERGLELEKLVTRLFKAKGYNARHNVKLVGRSGVKHQIDVYAEYKAPLHTSKIVVECKSYDKPIDKDIVIKLIHEVEDLGVDKGILITTSYFTPDAVSTAEGYNVDLWNGTKLNELLREIGAELMKVPLNMFHVRPYISINKASKIVDKTIRGIFRRKGSIESSSIIFYPYYEVDIDARIYELKGFIKKRTEERIVSSTILIDSITGDLCLYDPENGVISMGKLPALSAEEERVFQILLTKRSLTVSALASLINCSTSKARKILQGLVVKGLAKIYRKERQTFYQSAIRIPDPSQIRTISMSLKIESGEPKKGVKITPALNLEKVESLVRALWRGSIKNYKTVFYPYYACKMVEREKRYIRAVDMLNKKIDDRISRILIAFYQQLPF